MFEEAQAKSAHIETLKCKLVSLALNKEKINRMHPPLHVHVHVHVHVPYVYMYMVHVHVHVHVHVLK